MEVINYKNSLVNLSNSILNYFGIKPFHETLTEIDEILKEKQCKNVVLLLCDGMGSYNLKNILNEDKFITKNKINDITSVFPPTTTAATISVLTGKDPSEHNWYGWDMYFKDSNETIALFINETKEDSLKPKISVFERDYMNYKTIVDLINEESDNEAYYAYPFYKENPCKNLDEVIQEITKLCNMPNKKFIYAYIESPDKEMHHFGVNSNETKEKINIINSKLEDLSKELKDTLIIVTADHGQVDTKTITLKDDIPEIYNILERTTSIEARACGMKLKDNVTKEEFEHLFNKYLKDDFICLNTNQVIESKLFGNYDNKYLRDNIGDYLIIGIKDKAINYDENSPIFIGNHAGFTKEEITIPLIIIDCK